MVGWLGWLVVCGCLVGLVDWLVSCCSWLLCLVVMLVVVGCCGCLIGVVWLGLFGWLGCLVGVVDWFGWVG